MITCKGIAHFALFLTFLSLASGTKIFWITLDEGAGVATGSRMEIKDYSAQHRKAWCLPSRCPLFGITGMVNKAARFGGKQLLETPGIWLQDGTIALWYRINGVAGGHDYTSMPQHVPGTASTDIYFAGSATFGIGRMLYNPGLYAQSRSELTSNNNNLASWGGYWCNSFYSVPTANGGTLSTWYHVAFVFDSGQVTVYLQGRKEGSIPSPSSISTCSKNVQFVGGRAINSDYFQGDIDEFFIDDSPLSADQVLAVYNGQ